MLDPAEWDTDSIHVALIGAHVPVRCASLAPALETVGDDVYDRRTPLKCSAWSFQPGDAVSVVALEQVPCPFTFLPPDLGRSPNT